MLIFKENNSIDENNVILSNVFNSYNLKSKERDICLYKT